MNLERLKNNLIDLLEEDQLKLGYRRESVRLYYPRHSVCHLLEVPEDTTGLSEMLDRFCHFSEPELGRITIHFLKDGRIGFVLPPEASEYVQKISRKDGFLPEFIEMMRHHGHSLEDVIRLFHQHSEKVEVQFMDHTEFDLLLHFTGGIPDDYYYCISQEGPHLSYHRFIREDYEALGF